MSNKTDSVSIDYLISIQSEDRFKDKSKWGLSFRLKGDRNEFEFKLDESSLVQTKPVSTPSTNGNAFLYEFKIHKIDIGKVKQLNWMKCDSDDEFFIYEIQIRNLYRNELQIFPVEQVLNENIELGLRPNLKPGEQGINYVATTHTGTRQNSKSTELNIVIQLIGEKAKTKFIPLQHSQLHKQAFVSGKKDIFDFIASDVGRITKVILGNHSPTLSNLTWFVDNLEIKILNNLQLYNFSVNKNLSPKEEVILLPMNNTEIVYQVILRSNDIEGHRNFHTNKHLTDIYFIIMGAKGCTKKICLNNYDSRKPEHHDYDPKEKFFEFKSEDVGKIQKINVSINQDNNPHNFILIDFIEIKIPSRSEAYKFPIERVLGEYFEDGRCELDLEVWKHPERPSHIEYEILSETGTSHDKESRGKVYLIIHGDHTRTGKIELNDGDFENSLMDNYEFAAPDVGKITKIELFYIPLTNESAWQLESIQIKVACRNEAYKFPIHCWLNSKTSYLELLPWKKPVVHQDQ